MLALAGCSSDDSIGGDPFPDIPTCASWIGKPVAAADIGDGCIVDRSIYGVATINCRDGRTLFWNDAGWGYTGGVFRAHEAGAELTAPPAERGACNG